MDFASRGKAALADKNAHLAVELFTRALIQHPTSPNFYTQRSIAYARLKSEDGGPDHLSSFKNAKIAEHLAEQRGSRELLLAAQMRRAIALYHLEYYADALALLEKIETWVEKKKSSEKPDETGTGKLFAKHESIMMELPIWKMKTEKKLDGLSEDAKKSASALEAQHSKFVPDEKYLKAELEAWLSGKSAEPTAEQSQQTQPATSAEASSTTQTDASSKAPTTSTETSVEKVRHDWYQTTNEVLVTLYVKKVPADKLESEFNENNLSIQFPLPSGATYDFSIDPLYAPIDVPNSKVKVMGTKIEITLAKKSSNLKWHALESTGSTPVVLPPRNETPKEEPKTKAGPAQASKAAKKDDTIDSDDEEQGDPVDSFFKSLYAKADPDTRRAMMKSYIESNGTALSTNWSDVGSKKVEEHPPN